ncbi:MAG: hypothetical protein ABSE42_14690 [Bryobacteraceae bacterium]|jgi:hypothetical protein
MPDSRRVFVLAAGAILFYQLISPPVAGLADNGDFGKVIGRFGLYGQVHRTCEYIDTVYSFRSDKHWVSGFFSLEIPLARLAVWLNRAVSKDGNFDLRWIGIVHGALFLLAVWLFVPLLAAARRGVRWGACALALFMFCDMMYVSPLNSFYMHEPAYLFLLLTAVIYLRVIRFGGKLGALLLMLCPFLLVSAKAQHALIGLWIAILFFVAANHLRPFAPRRWYAAAVCLVVASLLMIWKAQPADYSSYPLYNATFDEILPHSNNVERTLADLGLDDSYRSCIGKNAFQPDSGMFDPAFQRRFIERLSYGKLAVFYTRHPAVAYHAVLDGLSEAGRQHSFGNFDISAGYPPYTEDRAFALWSDAKRHVFYHHGFAYLLSFLALATVFGALLWLDRERLPRGTLPAGFCLVGAAVTELCVSTLCECTEMTRHSTIFFALFDMIALACAYLALSSVVPRAIRGALAVRFHPRGSADAEDIADGAGRQAQAPAPIPPPEPAPVPAPSSPPVPAPDMRRVDRCLFAAGALLLAVYFFRLTRASLQVYFTPNDLMNLYQSWIFSAGLLVKSNLLFFLAYDYVRPMGDAWYRVIVDFAGFQPFWFHVSNLAILAANIWLTYAVARRLASREIAALTALAMAYQLRLAWLYFDTGFIYDVLCYFFLFAALALYLRVRVRAAALRPWQWAALFALYVCALNSKEMAVMLPAFLGTYELLYHPPRAWQVAMLHRWLLREGRAALVTGAVAVVFFVGRSIGPQGLINLPAYRPSFTWARFMLTSRHFAGDFLGKPDWPAWAVLLLWAALGAVAWFTASRVLRFAWLFLMLSPLPIAFIVPRGSPQYYVCVFGWMLYAAALLVKLASLLTRGVPLAEWWLSRARGAALFVVSMAILYSAYKPLGYAGVYSAAVEAPQNRETVAQLHAAAPAIRPGSRLLFLNDPIPADSYHLLFLVRLSYDDRSLQVFRVKEMQPPPNDKEIAAYDYVLDYRNGRFFELKAPGLPAN